MYVVEESDRAVVPTKEPNKGGEPSAEVLEGRTRAKENDDEPRTVRTQRRTDRAYRLPIGDSQGDDGVIGAVRDQKIKGTEPDFTLLRSLFVVC